MEWGLSVEGQLGDYEDTWGAPGLDLSVVGGQGTLFPAHTPNWIPREGMKNVLNEDVSSPRISTWWMTALKSPIIGLSCILFSSTRWLEKVSHHSPDRFSGGQ